MSSAIQEFQIHAAIGRGPLGEVFAATREDAPYPLALKLLHQEFGIDKIDIARLTRAGTILRQIEQPGLVPIYALGSAGDRFFVVSPRDSGDSFARRWSLAPERRQALDPTTALQHVAQVAMALTSMHAAGVVHGNLKPGNIRIYSNLSPRLGEERRELSEPGELRLTDGLYAELVAGHDVLRRHADTAIYGAPEQFDGTVSERSDQYALAVLSWIWLLGSPPFYPRSVATILESKKQVERLASEWATRAHSAVLAVLQRALQPKAAERYAQVEDFHQALVGAVNQAIGQGGVRSPAAAGDLQLSRRTLLVGAGAAAGAIGAVVLAHPVLPHLATLATQSARRTSGTSPSGATPLVRYTMLRELRGHTDQIESVAWSPDGRMLASASDDETIRIWDSRQDYATIATLRGHTKFVLDLAWSADGDYLASASADSTTRIWSLASGVATVTLAGHTGFVYGVAWVPSSTNVVTIGADGWLRSWDAMTGAQLYSNHVSSQELRTIAFSPDATLFVTGGADKLIRLWNAGHFEVLYTLAGSTGEILAAAFAPSSGVVASVGLDPQTRLWNTVLHSSLGGIQRGAGALARALDWSRASDLMVTGAVDGTVAVRTARGSLVDSIHVFGEARSVAWHPNGGLLAVGTAHSVIQIWQPA